MTSTHVARFAAVLTASALSPACVDDADDGKPSAVEVVILERDAGSDDQEDARAVTSGEFDPASAALALTCRAAVLTDTAGEGFSVQLADAEDVAGTGLFVSLSPSTGTVRSEAEGGVIMDADGKAEFSFMAPHFDFDQDITLNATLRDDDMTALARAQCTFSVVAKVVRFSEPRPGTLLPFKERMPIKAQYVIDDNIGTCEGGGGANFSVAGPVGVGLSLARDEPPRPSLCVDLSEERALPDVFLHGGTVPGFAQVEVKIRKSVATLSLGVVGEPASLALTADDLEIERNSAVNLMVSVRDLYGQLVSGAQVVVEVERCASGVSGPVCGGLESASPATVSTGPNGGALAAYFAGDTPGAALVRVRSVDVPSVNASLVIRVN